MALTYLIKGVFYKFFLLYIKISESAYLTYYQKNREVILNRAKHYYENDKEISRDKYINLSEEGKNKKENVGRIDAAMCLKKRKKLKKHRKIIARQKSNFNYNFNNYANKIVF